MDRYTSKQIPKQTCMPINDTQANKKATKLAYQKSSKHYITKETSKAQRK